jgi:uncharacterized membrane protein (UPF0136 family)
MAQYIDLARDYILFMAVVVLAGGIMGYVKASSKASLVSGVISAALLGLTFWFGVAETLGGIKHLGESFIASFLIYALLEVVFVMRLFKSKKLIPAAPILFLCVVGQVLSMSAFRHIMTSANYRG